MEADITQNSWLKTVPRRMENVNCIEFVLAYFSISKFSFADFCLLSVFCFVMISCHQKGHKQHHCFEQILCCWKGRWRRMLNEEELPLEVSQDVPPLSRQSQYYCSNSNDAQIRISAKQVVTVSRQSRGKIPVLRRTLAPIFHKYPS